MMDKRLLFCALMGVMTACQQEADIQPNASNLAREVVGTYRTNVYLDPSRVATSSDQMPYVDLKAESDSTVTLIYTSLSPMKTSMFVEHVALSQQAIGIQLRTANSVIGTLQADRIFTNSGMEKQGDLLRISLQNGNQNTLLFSGTR